MENLRIISCFRFSLQLIIIEMFFVINLPRKPRFVPRVVLALAGYCVLAATNFYIFKNMKGNEIVLFALYYTALFSLTLLAMWVCFDVQIKEVLFAGTCAYAIQHIAFACYTIFTTLVPLLLNSFADFILLRFAPYLLAGYIAYCLLIKRHQGKSELKQRDLRMILLALVILITVVFVSVIVDSAYFASSSIILRNVFCKIYAILCCMLSVFVAFNLSRQNHILNENEMMENMLLKSKEQQALSKETIQIINIKCHDLKYRIANISKIENDEAQQMYVEEIRSALNIYDNIFQTGNETLDLVLTEKSLLCNERNIKMSCMVDKTSLSFISNTDLYVLLGNLLDNAIESVLKEPCDEKRIISIYMRQKDQGYHIHTENYCPHPVEFEQGLPITTKGDSNYHGFGTKSIKYIVEKYKGDLLMHTDAQKFLVDILFYTNLT